MENIKTFTIFLGGLLGGVTAYLFGGWNEILSSLLFFQIVDFGMGIASAHQLGEGNSKTMIKGLYKKLGTWVALAVAYRVNVVMPLPNIDLLAVGLGAFNAYEVYSILEKLGKLGVATDFLAQYMEQVRIVKEKKEADRNDSK